MSFHTSEVQLTVGADAPQAPQAPKRASMGELVLAFSGILGLMLTINVIAGPKKGQSA